MAAQKSVVQNTLTQLSTLVPANNLPPFLQTSSALPEEINNDNFINSGDLSNLYPIYITAARVQPGNFDDKPVVRFDVWVQDNLPIDEDYHQLTWTPSATPERVRVANLFAKNEHYVLGPVSLKAVPMRNGSTYYALSNDVPESALPF